METREIGTDNPHPLMIEDDIQSNVQDLLENSNDTLTSDDDSDKRMDNLKVKFCQLLQAERNKWKEKVQNSLQEIDKNHRTMLATKTSLQELVNSVYLTSQHPGPSDNKQHNIPDLLTKLGGYIRDSKALKDRSSRENILNSEMNILREDLSRLNQERTDQFETISALNKEIQWLQRELASVKSKLSRVRGIVKNYNEARSSSFHLDEVVIPELKLTDGTDQLITRERTYHEGEQTVADTTPREAFSIMKLREKRQQNLISNIPGQSPRPPGNQNIGKCLRCQILFRVNENNNMACRFHRKGREITECYNNQGKLLRVVYKWGCCKKPLDTSGCAHGYHI